MIYDEVGEVFRRYGKTGYKIIADNECLKSFFRRRGDWTMYDEECSGANYMDWETRGDVVYLEHQYCGSKAKIKKSTFLEIMEAIRALTSVG